MNKGDFKTFLYNQVKTVPPITEIIKETGLTRPTIAKFLNGEFDQLAVKNLKKLCDFYGLVVWIESPELYGTDITESEFYPISDLHVELDKANLELESNNQIQ